MKKASRRDAFFIFSFAIFFENPAPIFLAAAGLLFATERFNRLDFRHFETGGKVGFKSWNLTSAVGINFSDKFALFAVFARG